MRLLPLAALCSDREQVGPSLYLYLLSRPLLLCLLGEYWFRLSRYVYGRNRSFAPPILRQSQWSLLYDVY
jgi:hypothetical protein